jgi:hypothetical protein
METPGRSAAPHERSDQSERIISAVLPDGRLVELLHDPITPTTAFAVWDGTQVQTITYVDLGHERRLVPYPASNNLLRHRVVLFPSKPEEYSTPEELIAEITAYLHRYMDLSPTFERLAAHYALFSWVYDCFNELPYLRLKGDFGTGKTRFLITLGSICYKPIFASGASTVSPIFHMLDVFGGTLLVDEADFRFSDERAQITKILNNGNARGFPVLRTESKNGRDFNPRAFQVFGPKVVAMRGHFDDQALESRFITEHAGGRPLRADIPINLPLEQAIEAEHLRNKLLMYRFRSWGRVAPEAGAIDAKLEPRLKQIYTPLFSIIADEATRADLLTIAHGFDRTIKSDRGFSLEVQVLTAVRALALCRERAVLPIKDIVALFNRGFGSDYGSPVSSRWIGAILRRKLNLATAKSHGLFVVPMTERPKLAELWARYGISEEDADAFLGTTGPLPDDLDLSWVDVGEDGETRAERASRGSK